MPQLWESMKDEALAPATAILEMERADVPSLLNVADFAADVVFTVWLPKLKALADKVAVGPEGALAVE